MYEAYFICLNIRTFHICTYLKRVNTFVCMERFWINSGNSGNIWIHCIIWSLIWLIVASCINCSYYCSATKRHNQRIPHQRAREAYSSNEFIEAVRHVSQELFWFQHGKTWVLFRCQRQGDRSKTPVCQGPMIEGDSLFSCPGASAEFGATQPVKIRVPTRIYSVNRLLDFFPQQLVEMYYCVKEFFCFCCSFCDIWNNRTY